MSLRKGFSNNENIMDICALVADLAPIQARQALELDTKKAFELNTPDIMMAQSVLTANDSTFTLAREEAKENKDMFAMPVEQRFAKAESGFKSNMNNIVHKTIITPKGHARGYETNGSSVIKVNFAANRFNTFAA